MIRLSVPQAKVNSAASDQPGRKQALAWAQRHGWRFGRPSVSVPASPLRLQLVWLVTAQREPLSLVAVQPEP